MNKVETLNKNVRAHRAKKKISGYYEAADNTTKRNLYHRRGSVNDNIKRDASTIMTQARYAVDNHDLAAGILRVMTTNVVGSGVGIEPQPRRKDGTIHVELAQQMRELFRDWSKRPEVTHRHSFGKVQQLQFSGGFRDGDHFAQMLSGMMPTLDHGTRVPFSLELISADMVPFTNDENNKILQGVEINDWGRPRALHVIKASPWQTYHHKTETKRIPWNRVLQTGTFNYTNQVRGISAFAPIINRLEDVRDYEESERIAAKLSARITGVIKKGTPELYDSNNSTDRLLSLQAGTIIDDLAPGEDLSLLNTTRPNPNLIHFRSGQLRAAAAGVGANASSISKNYDGTYSAQRQEMVEQYAVYAAMTDDFVSRFVQPVWEEFVRIAVVYGLIDVSSIDTDTLDDAMFVGQAMPWIDPLKEAMGYSMLINDGLASEAEIIRKRGLNPYDVIEQSAAFKKKMQDAGLVKVDGKVTLLDALKVMEDAA